MARSAIRFILNDRDIVLDRLPATGTLLDFLRLERRLRGSKEGCAEGDCGACTVLVGRLRGDELVYETVTACITFTASLDATHVVTIEHLSGPGNALHPVQQAMVDHHGSQCGFCTPGIVMSLYGLWMQTPDPGSGQVERALQGNLCRCTGYAPIVRAARAVSTYGEVQLDPLLADRELMIGRLRALQEGQMVETGSGKDRVIVPATADQLAQAYQTEPEATIVAGATDVGLWVTKFMRPIGPLIFIGHLAELQRIEETDEAITFGAGLTYTRARETLVRAVPTLEELWDRIGGEQVRNMGTIGGNIANGSPIGDTPPPLIVLGATVTLRKGSERRTLLLEDFFIAYGRQDRAPGEFVESVTIPKPRPEVRVAAYKVSKRREEDISSLCGAFAMQVSSAGIVEEVRIAFGGMAATPKRARAVEAALIGKPWTSETVEAGVAAFTTDYQPITDMRASAEYRLLAAQNLLRRFHLETTGEPQRLRRGMAA